MVKQKFYNRDAFTMIELVFAIVIIGITIVSLPMMSEVTSKGIQKSFNQEVIFGAYTRINQVVAYRWDENSRDLDINNSVDKVVATTATDCNSTTKRREGHIDQSYHRRCLNDTSIRPSNLGIDGSDDVDDNVITGENLFANTSGTQDSYKDKYSIDVGVTYATFGDENSSSKNIKEIKVTVKDSSSNTITSLKTYVANIGEVDYLRKIY